MEREGATMKARQRTYEQGLRDGIRKSVDAIMSANIVAMDDRRLCKATIRYVSSKSDFLFRQVLDGELSLEDILESAAEILKEG